MELKYQRIQKEHLHSLAEKLTMQEYSLLLEGSMHGLTAKADEQTAGILLFRKVADKLLMLERIEVEEPYQRQGIGTGMMQVFCKHLRAAGFELMLSFEAEETDTGFVPFLLSLRTFYIEENEGFEALLSSEEVSAVCKTFTSEKVVPKLYFEQSRAAQQEFLRHLEESYPMIGWELKYTPQAFSRDLCCCETDKNGTMQAVCLMKKSEDELELSFLYARGGMGTLAAKALIGSINQFRSREPLPLRMTISNENAANILKHMSKHYEITKRGYTAYYLGE